MIIELSKDELELTIKGINDHLGNLSTAMGAAASRGDAETLTAGEALHSRCWKLKERLDMLASKVQREGGAA